MSTEIIGGMVEETRAEQIVNDAVQFVKKIRAQEGRTGIRGSHVRTKVDGQDSIPFIHR